LSSVVLPPPLAPRIIVIRPASALRLTPLSTGGLPGYANHTLSASSAHVEALRSERAVGESSIGRSSSSVTNGSLAFVR
jgi:hypothetical protein